jgi:hypothetical protein
MHQIWFGRSITSPRNRYGNTLCPGTGFVVRGIGPSAAMPILRISRRTLAIAVLGRPHPA